MMDLQSEGFIFCRRFMVVNWPQVSANYKAAMSGDMSMLTSYASA